jgi:hypothetical protein
MKKLGEEVDAVDEDVETDEEATEPAVVGTYVRMDSGSSDSSDDEDDEATARAEEEALFTTNKRSSTNTSRSSSATSDAESSDSEDEGAPAAAVKAKTTRRTPTPKSPARHAVGARVEVLWKGKLFAAEVMKCHRTGAYDVVYEKDGTEGTLVTHEEHRLVPLTGKGARGGGSSGAWGGGGRGGGSRAEEASWSEEEEVRDRRVHQAGPSEGRVHQTRSVRDVPDWRLHHHGCEQVTALQ